MHHLLSSLSLSSLDCLFFVFAFVFWGHAFRDSFASIVFRLFLSHACEMDVPVCQSEAVVFSFSSTAE